MYSAHLIKLADQAVEKQRQKKKDDEDRTISMDREQRKKTVERAGISSGLPAILSTLFAPEYQAREAGAARTLAESMGKKPGVLLSYPLSSATLMGALPGVALGAMIKPPQSLPEQVSPLMFRMGMSALGGSLGYLLLQALIRSRINTVSKIFREHRGPLHAVKPKFNPLSWLLYGGAHARRGRAEAAYALQHQERPNTFSPVMSEVLSPLGAATLPALTGQPIGLPLSIAGSAADEYVARTVNK